MAKRILKMTETLAVVKISGTGSSDTITLNTDLLSSTMVVDGTPRVNIAYVQWNVSSAASDTITITRGGTPVLNLYQNAGELDLSGNGGYSDDTGNDQPLVVTITGTGNLYLTLRKVSGYKSKIETAQFGSYDNTTVVGS